MNGNEKKVFFIKMPIGSFSPPPPPRPSPLLLALFFILYVCTCLLLLVRFPTEFVYMCACIDYLNNGDVKVTKILTMSCTSNK